MDMFNAAARSSDCPPDTSRRRAFNRITAKIIHWLGLPGSREKRIAHRTAAAFLDLLELALCSRDQLSQLPWAQAWLLKGEDLQAAPQRQLAGNT